MSKFTASNGITVEIGQRSISFLKDRKRSVTLLSEANIAALAEFFRHKRDQELGRWRDPKNPFMVVYPRIRGRIRVVSELTGRSWNTDQQINPDFPYSARKAAEHYFAAHPPKPWHTAKPGEAWVLTLNGHEEDEAVVVQKIGNGHPVFVQDNGSHISVEDEAITAGRRVWPVGGEA